MKKHENLTAVKKAYKAFKRDDIQTVLSIMDDDVEWTTPGKKDLVPFVGQFKGRDAVAKFFEALAANEEVLAFEPHQFIADGDVVAAGVHYKGRVKATGRTYEGETVHVFRFRNCKVASFKEYLDTVMMASAYRAA
jgi:uncharacterized protein